MMDPDDFMSSHGTWVQTNKDTWKLFGITEMSLSAWNKGANTKLSVITKQQEEGQEKRNEELLELATTRQRGLSTPRWVSSATPTTTPTGSICQPVPSSSPNLEESFASFTPASGDVLRPFWADWERRWKEGFCLHFGESSSTPVSVLPSPPRPW
jgi:hypothetical protein